MTALYEDEHLVLQRLEKVADLRRRGIDPYPIHTGRTHEAAQVVAAFEQEPALQVCVAGRLVGAKRIKGGQSFAHLLDGSGRIQISFRRDLLGEEQYDFFRDSIDPGDFFRARGETFRTRSGEISVQATEIALLAKALREPPDKWHGLTNPEVRLRRRYLDLVANPDVRVVFEKRARAIQALRAMLFARGFLEVETPVLQSLAGGGAARPFETHSNALEEKQFLRIALELFLKRCIIGGIDRVFEIGKIFRNEGISFKHHPEFTMLELYQAYADYQDIMRLTEDMVAEMARAVNGSLTIERASREEGGAPILMDFTPPWRRLTLREALITYSGVDYREHRTNEALIAAARRAGLQAASDWNRGKVLDELLTLFVEPNLQQPTFLLDYPVEYPGSTLAKRKPGQEDEVERFEGFAGGMELANAFSELNDPLDQRGRFEEQKRLKAAGDLEAQPFDADFIEALEYGMPPTGGLGVGIDRVVMLLTGQSSIREVVLFPQMRSRG